MKIKFVLWKIISNFVLHTENFGLLFGYSIFLVSKSGVSRVAARDIFFILLCRKFEDLFVYLYSELKK